MANKARAEGLSPPKAPIVLTKDQGRALKRRLPLPQKLEFFAWWREPASLSSTTPGALRKDVRVVFDTSSGGFSLRFADGAVKVSSAEDTKRRVLDGWDLHVGAQLILLGRKTTLRQTACQATAAWLVSEATFLMEIRSNLRSALSKYGLFPRGDASAHERAVRHAVAFRKTPEPSAVNLRRVLLDIDQLHQALAEIEPREAWLLTSHLKVGTAAAAVGKEQGSGSDLSVAA
ncbi:hypothetical protein JKP88DRAFT_317639 [Tribonema minus]|uniref:Uncharacterized protein n=1 Tax=Tribonema minus TaxID=303371 RepID=A0A835YYT3_9STRA|nr:hypothetical protein JKP88DRAFT_317639 [Tribonema minus]